MAGRTVWSHAKVVDTSGTALIIRTYLEQMDVRRHLADVSRCLPITAACDVGAGYGRLSVVLTEFAHEVVAFERESAFVADARRFLPQIDFRQVETLADLPVDSHVFQFVLTFTVLQHLGDSELIRAVEEIKRIVAKPGYVLLCEETDVNLHYYEGDSTEGGSTIGRSVEQYATLMAPFVLITTSPRRVEPAYPRRNVGAYMLFRSNEPQS